MNSKAKNLVSLLVLVLVVGTGVFIYSTYFGSGLPPTPPMENGVSFSIFQALRVSYTDGSDSWKYPESRTSLLPMVILDPNAGKEVSSSQAYIYFNLAASQAVSKVDFSATGTVGIYTASRTLKLNLGSMPIAKSVANPLNATDTYVVSATTSADGLASKIVSSSMPYFGAFYYVLSMSDIKATVTYAGGSTVVYGLTGVQATENQLWWKFAIVQSGTLFQITSESVEWIWK